MWCPSYEKSNLSTTATFFCPQGGRCGGHLKIPWKSKIIMYSYIVYVALLNLQFLIFFFRQKRITKICLEQGWADLQGWGEVQKWLHQYRSTWSEGHHGHRKEITSCQVGLWTFIANILSCYLLNFRKRFSSGNVCWHRPGNYLNVTGLSLKFQVARYMYIKLVVGGRGGISLWKQPFLFTPRRWQCFARRNVCDSVSEIPYWWH